MERTNALEIEREKIDAIDSQIIQLLEHRMDVVTQIASIKKQQQTTVLDTEREELVLKKVAANVTKKEYLKTIQATYEDIMKQSKTYQNEKIGGE